MSRKYLNDRWCARCTKKDPTPYLRNNIDKLQPPGHRRDTLAVLDIGCGNGRNTEFMRSQGFTNIVSLDMVDGYRRSFKITLGKDRFPVFNNTVAIILANYVFMFLNKKERKQLIQEIKRVARPEWSAIVLELYPAKDSFAPDKQSMLKLQEELFEMLGWRKVRYSQGRFIATAP